MNTRSLLISVILVITLLTACGSPATTTPLATALPDTETPVPPTATSAPPTETSTPTVVPTPTLGIGSTMVGKDGMTLVYVPEGKFLMGSKDTDVPSLDNERPQRLVNLDAFWIDATEVTNKQYRPCIDAEVCSPKVDAGDDWRIYNNDSKYDDYPAVFVDWKNASAYCEWLGRRLPTEAEWEKAARGTDGQIYPWGSSAPNNDLLNYNGKINFPTAVKSYPDGVSPYGAYDMAGNVLEWVSDWYSDAYYSIAPLLNPLGPESGTRHIGRGGSNNSGADVVRSAYRFHVAPNFFGQLTYNDGGFRCALSAK